jgi:AcrR family transcriptional regulator
MADAADAVRERSARAPARRPKTRDRILDAARTLFAEHGYERTTIRGVACAAEINPSLVIRYFGSKEGLFTASTEIDLKVVDLSQVPEEKRGEAIVARFLDRWEGGSGDELAVMLRAAASHEGARAKYLEAMQRQVRPMIATVCAADRLDTCMALCATQLSGLAMTRFVLRVPTVVALDREFLVRRIGAVIQDYLTTPE